MALSKTDFIQYLNCPKSLWLMLNRSSDYPVVEFSEYARKLTAEGYEVERFVQALIESNDDAEKFSFQKSFETEDGLIARADVIRNNEDGSIDIYEVKSSTSVKDKNPHNQLKDAAFQVIASQRSGLDVRNIFIVHLNKDYVREGDIDPGQLLVFADETARVKALLDETIVEIDQALALLKETKIDETSCTCLMLGMANHCDSFDYFNPDIPRPSIYNLPRISTNKNFKAFVGEGRFDLDSIDLSEVSKLQKLVLQAHQSGSPVINYKEIRKFLGALIHPLYFLDYETFASAVPIVEGARPQSPVPFQFSLHIIQEDGSMEHVEYLADEPKMPTQFIEALEAAIGPAGSVVSWHMAFENTQNKTMAQLYSDKADFLNDIISRTVDLEDIFKTGYVDIQFGGSTSIKKVLPIVVPELSYDGMDIADGTAAMDGWKKMLDLPAGPERDQLRKSLLDYCKLDTLAMVRIFQFVESVAEATGRQRSKTKNT